LRTLRFAWALPLFFLVAMRWAYTLDFPMLDQWELPLLLQRWHDGALDAAALLAQHNEHRPALPRLIMLAMAAAKSTDSKVFKDKVMDVANAPGEKIFPGELGKALDIIAAGGDVDYVGASAVELIGPGESAGNYREVDVQGGKFVTKQYR